jgi:hypothetical protein
VVWAALESAGIAEPLQNSHSIKGAVMTFEIESRWRGAPIKVTVEAKRTPQKKARELRALTEAPVQVWLCKDHMRYLVHETN